MSRRSRLFAVGFAFASSLAATAHADTYPPCTKQVSASDSNAAHEKYIAGKQDYDERNYESAIRRFRDAYAMDCTKHELLIIISNAYERKGDRKEAITALETYVARAPNAPDVSTYQVAIENLKKQLAAQPPAQAQPAPAPAPSPRGAGETREPREVREHSPWPWVVVGVGGAAVATGIILLAVAPERPENCDPDTRECEALPGRNVREDEATAEDAVNLRRAGAIVAITGGALVAGGLIWHFLEPTGPKDGAKLRPAVAPGFAGLSLGGRF